MAPSEYQQAQKIIYLISRYHDGTIDFAELQELNAWRKSSDHNEALFQQIIDPEQQAKAVQEMLSYDTKGSLEKIKLVMQQETKQKQIRTLYLKRILIAAISLSLIGTFCYKYFDHKKDYKQTAAIAHPAYIPAATNKATLTLASGKKISINQYANGTIASQGSTLIQNAQAGKLTYSTKDIIANNEPLAYNTIETPRAGKYKIQLADGTNVWLNAASSFHYPVAFNGHTREVELIGEAYFEVAKDKHKPFIVTSNGQKVTVLGTHFNINAYKDEAHTKTTLLEGSVRVTSDKRDALLQPGEESTLSNESIKISKADVHLATAWKDGQLAFSHTDLKTMLRQISRWYNIDIVYVGKVPDISITGDASGDADLSAMLKILQFYNIHFKQQDRKLIIID